MEPLGIHNSTAQSVLASLPRDRRRAVRQKVHTPAYASLNGGMDDMVLDLSEILDISETGVAIQTSSSWTGRRVLNLCLDLSETNTYLQTTGQVVWADRKGRIGVRFPELPPASRQKLQEWLFLNAMVGAANYAAQHRELEPVEEPEAPEITAGEGPAAEILPPEIESRGDYTTTLVALSTVQRQVEVLGADLNGALHLIAERAFAFTRASGAAIALTESRGMVCRASTGDAPPVGATFDANSGFSGYCVRSGFLQRCDDAQTDLRVDRESCRLLGIRSMIAVPIRLGGAVIGLLEVFSPQEHAFNDRDGTILQRLADTALAAVNRASRARAMQRAAETPKFLTSTGSISFGPSSPSSGSRPFSAQTDTSDNGESFGLPQRHLRLLVIAALSITLVLGYVLFSWFREKPHVAKNVPATSTQPDSSPAATEHSGSLVRPSPSLADVRKRAELGDPYEQVSLAARYATGEDVPQDYSMAARWLLRAAEQGHVGAQDTLGTYYFVGRGVPKDVTRAYFWSVLARASGKDASKVRVAVMTSQLTRAQAMAIQQQANQFLKQHPPLRDSESTY